MGLHGSGHEKGDGSEPTSKPTDAGGYGWENHLRESQRNGFGSGQRLSKARLSGWLGCCEGLDHAEGIGLDPGKGLDPVKWSHLPEG